jgi:hypothetical protein
MEDNYSPGWCPFCGDPESVCEAYGGCGNADDTDGDFENENEDETKSLMMR